MDKFKIGDNVTYLRSVSTWSRITNERLRGTVIAVLPKRVRIKLHTGIKNSQTALVVPERLQLELD